jgi:tetratricopeptide (TPR) repeat protein
MEALVSALLRGRVNTPRRGLIVAGGLLALSAVVLGSGFLMKRGNEDYCRRGADHLQGVWDQDRKATIERSFAASGIPLAKDAWKAVDTTLDAYASQWLAMYYDTCAATHIRHEQSEHVLDLRMRCLRERLGELSSLIRLYEKADGDVVGNAVAAAAKLSQLSVCVDGVALAATHAPPSDTHTRFAVEHLRDRMASARNLARVGKPLKAIETARVLASEAEELGHPPVVAESLQLVGELEMTLQQLDLSQNTLRRAAQAAETAGHDAVKALAWIQLAHVARQLEGELDTADTAIAFAAAVLERNANLKELGVLLHSVSGLRRLDSGDTQGALQSLQQAVTLGEALFGDSHPRVAGQLGNLGELYHSTGDYPAAVAAFRRATTILEQSYGARSPLAAEPLAGLAQTLLELGRLDEALTNLRRQLDAYERAYGPSNGRLAKTHSLMGRALAQQGLFDAALGHHSTAAHIAEAAYGRNHWRVGRSLRYLGETLLMQERYTEALVTFRRGWSIYEPLVQPGDVEPACLLAGIGRAQLAARQPRTALQPLRRSIELWQEAGNQSPRDLARARFAYARALALTNTDPQEARRLVRSAHGVFAAGGLATADDLDEVRVWLTERTEPSKEGRSSNEW